MKKPTTDLMEEHEGIMLMLQILGKVADKLHSGESIQKEHLDKIVEFLKNFADNCHHGKEEDILFPELAKNPLHTKTINELVGEHKTGRDYIRGMADSLPVYSPGNADAIHIAENAKGYIELLTEHIHKENTVLFPIADRELSEETQKDIDERFETLERDVIGQGKHEEYHGWLKELQDTYLS